MPCCLCFMTFLYFLILKNTLELLACPHRVAHDYRLLRSFVFLRVTHSSASRIAAEDRESRSSAAAFEVAGRHLAAVYPLRPTVL
ncbi:hypothetical protein PHYSODRAFT_265339 [Phytophthora sojae]|uniref:Secreted protein n=2 Tax=Phytophthora sojae TaxID=67593 RepID=G4Z2F0_PHYSP|nr:hypothetical protein PHYSODRAFT_265339 [Phytophthora sojae]AEK81405.1 RxL469 [Phytophthora sojae]AEK81406.1 RxL469 [Phytophthora sojae]AEK81407.1 RxL469 [Phytophthora sojae]EGZ19991.1 hypothetical protein PHYSODRAFT_265339 [Phytophthora sojae]|eukprot:XP_009522708.1 hypothetical protein PHYSODRAFT_265339 [Phytophthora sojae]